MAYGKLRHSNIRGEKGTNWLIEIWQKDFDQPGDLSTEFNMQGEGFEITWSGQGKTRNRSFIGSECVINFYIQNNNDENFVYNDILKKGEKYHFVRIYKNSVSNANLWWYGYIQPGFDEIQNLPYPYSFKITATDSYGYYSKLKEADIGSETIRNTAVPISTSLLDFASQMNLSILVENNQNFFRTAIDWWRPEDTYQSNDPFALYRSAKGAFTEEPNTDEDGNVTNYDKVYKYKRIDVFNGLLKTFNAVGFLAEGHYYFTQPNTLANNVNGTLYYWAYRSTSIPGASSNINTTLQLDQSNHIVLGGSTITYDPSFESVKLEFILGGTTFFIPSGANLTSSFVAGAIQLDVNSEAELQLQFNAVYTENILASGFNFASGYNVTPTVRSSSFLTTATLIISITDGTTTKYLQPNTQATYTTQTSNFIWVASNSPLSIIIARGYNQSNVANALSEQFCYGLVENSVQTQATVNSNLILNDDTGPCQASVQANSNGSGLTFTTNLNFQGSVVAPGIIGDVSVQCTASNNYSQVGVLTGGISGSGYTQFWIINVNNPTPSSTSLLSENVFLYLDQSDGISSLAGGAIYKANQTQIPSSESFDLGDFNLGSTELNKLYSIQYFDSNNNQSKSAVSFQRGNPSTDAPRNINQLLVNEFLELQIEPLEILQADIQSNDISPLKLIKYSINDDSNFKFYTFLGGTFKAQSEIMSGEWFKINDQGSYVNENDPTQTQFKTFKQNTTPVATKQSIFNNSILIDDNLNSNSLGLTNANLNSTTAYARINLNANVRGKYYLGQKLFLAYPDGSNQLEITCSATKTGVSFVDVVSITPAITYPIGSLILVNTADLTNVSFGEGDSLIANNIGTIYDTQICLTATDFVSTNSSTSPGNVDSTGAFITAPTSSTLLIANFQIPLGYKGVSVIVYGNDTSSTFTVKKSQVDNRASTEVGSSIAINSTRTLSSGQNGVAGVYWSIIVNLGATNRLITGAKIIIATI